MERRTWKLEDDDDLLTDLVGMVGEEEEERWGGERRWN